MRFGTTSYFLGLVKLTGNFQTYYTRGKKSRVIFCETRLAPARPKSQKRKPLPRIIIYFFGALGNQVESNYQKGDYVVVQGRLKLFKKQPPFPPLDGRVYPTKEYHLNVVKMSFIRRLE
jgi:single-stranded DNA-binding protein